MDEFPNLPPFLRKQPETLERLLREALQENCSDGAAGKRKLDIQASLATALIYQRKMSEARDLVCEMLHAEPDNNQTLWLEMLLAFYLNDPWPAAWKKLEARWGVGMTGEKPLLVGRLWDGSPLAGRSILLAGEGGLGDHLLFVRFAQSLKQRGAGRVIVSAPEPLLPLLSFVSEVDQVIPATDYETASSCDFSIPMMSVPFHLGLTRETIPRDVPYLNPPRIRRSRASSQIDKTASVIHVGICWQSANKWRRLPIELFRPLAAIPGVRLYGLGVPSEIEAEMRGFPITSLASTDILSTVEAILELDLVITTDTMAAHLTGALAKPVWLHLQFIPDWKWGLTGDTTPWYPSMRIFREESREGSEAFRRMSDELSFLSKTRIAAHYLK